MSFHRRIYKIEGKCQSCSEHPILAIHSFEEIDPLSSDTITGDYTLMSGELRLCAQCEVYWGLVKGP